MSFDPTLVPVYNMSYTANINLLLQQRRSILEDTVRTYPCQGRQANVINLGGESTPTIVTSRYQPIVVDNTPVDARWVSPTSYDKAQLVDNFETLKVLLNPVNVYTEAATAGFNRMKDSVILQNIFATNKTGQDGTDSTTFPAGNVIPVTEGAAAATGMNVQKIKAVQAEFLKTAGQEALEEDEKTIVITGTQHDNLLNDIQAIKNDYSLGVVWDESRGVIKRILGFNIRVVAQSLVPVDGSGYRRCPVYFKSGVALGKWTDIKTDVRQRTDLTSLPWQVYCQLTVGSTRLDERKVYEIKCSEA